MFSDCNIFSCSPDRFQVAQIPEQKPAVAETKTTSQEPRNSLFLGKPFGCSSSSGIWRYNNNTSIYGCRLINWWLTHFVSDIGNELLLLSALLHQSCDPICSQSWFIFKQLFSLSLSCFIPFIVSLSDEDGDRRSCYLTEDNHNFCDPLDSLKEEKNLLLEEVLPFLLIRGLQVYLLFLYNRNFVTLFSQMLTNAPW